MSSSRGKKTTVPTSNKRKGVPTFVGPTTKIHHPLMQFPRGPQEELFQILRARPLIAGRCIDCSAVEQVQMCWHTLAPSFASYNPSHSKASVLPPSLWYLHAILANTITGRRESTGVINTHDAYFLWCMSHGMLSMKMIERHRGTYPPQYCLAQSTEEEAYEDIPDDVPPQHEDPLTQPPPPSRQVHVAASYADISEHLTRFEQ
ncbi:hypothetical protein GOBAR_AA09242 [Gossypium barbadense]|uniref:Uncharacterized protein n=1 Tax=Gossypium barbadense TaxID=3634 RepID=A0A2P5Y737_GOSBA|nr:hypothetical protein GOBAR_AA09242 [Gossypium barbadense]